MLLFIDTETTGRVNFQLPEDHRDQPRLVQIGALLTDFEGKTIGQMEAMVQPAGFTIPRQVVAVHGITTERAMECGVDIRSVLSLFGQFCRMAKVVVGHNVGFDITVMRAEYKRAGVLDRLATLPRYCTMREATKILKLKDRRGRLKWPTLNETYRYFFGAELGGAHSAMNDALACRYCYEQIEGRKDIRDRQLTLFERKRSRYKELEAILE